MGGTQTGGEVVREGPHPRKLPYVRTPRPGHSWVPLLPQAPVLCILTPGTSFQLIPSYGAEGPERRCTGGQLDPSAPNLASQGGARSASGGRHKALSDGALCRPAAGNNSLVLPTHFLAAGGAGIDTWQTRTRAPPLPHPPPPTPRAQMHTHGPGHPEPLLSGVKVQQVWCPGSSDPAEACPLPACPPFPAIALRVSVGSGILPRPPRGEAMSGPPCTR